MSALFDIIRVPFGFVIRWIHSWSNSYFVAILLFGILIKIVLFPFGIKQQKNSQKQASLRPKESLIRKKYAGRNDRPTQMKLNQEIQELYQKENFSPLGGCLPMLVSMLVLLAVYGIVRSPLTYMATIPQLEEGNNPADTIKQTVTYMVYEGELEGKLSDFIQIGNVEDLTEQQLYEDFLHLGRYGLNSETRICTLLLSGDNGEKFVDYILAHNDRIIGKTDAEKRALVEAAIKAVPNMELFKDFNLGETPNLGDLFSKDAKLGQKLLLLIPLITLVTAYFGQSLTRKFTYQPEGTMEQQSQMRMMNIFMPLFSLFISFQVPAAVAIYWIIQNVTSPVQQIVLAKIYPIKELSPEELREAERLYGEKAEKKKAVSASSNGKKKRSLVYDDDDEYESVGTVEPKKTIQEKKENEGSIVDHAPLKDEEET